MATFRTATWTIPTITTARPASTKLRRTRMATFRTATRKPIRPTGAWAIRASTPLRPTIMATFRTATRTRPPSATSVRTAYSRALFYSRPLGRRMATFRAATCPRPRAWFALLGISTAPTPTGARHHMCCLLTSIGQPARVCALPARSTWSIGAGSPAPEAARRGRRWVTASTAVLSALDTRSASTSRKKHPTANSGGLRRGLRGHSATLTAATHS